MTECFHNKCFKLSTLHSVYIPWGCESDMILSVMTQRSEESHVFLGHSTKFLKQDITNFKPSSADVRPVIWWTERTQNLCHSTCPIIPPSGIYGYHRKIQVIKVHNIVLRPHFALGLTWKNLCIKCHQVHRVNKVQCPSYFPNKTGQWMNPHLEIFN